MKYKSGAKTKYDIPQYFEDMPDDFPIFCTIKEANTIKRIQNKITEEGKNKKNKSDKDKDKENKKKKEVRNSNNKEINIQDEPLPNESHKFCHLCKKRFDNYILHINSKKHNENRNKQKDAFKNINNIFKRINNFWNNNEDKKFENKNSMSNI